MSSRENRVILGAFVLFVVAFFALAYASVAFDVDTDRPIVGYILFGAIPIIGPQLYLAATTDDVSPRTRTRFAVIASLVIGVVFGGLEGWEERAVLAVGLGGYVAYVGYELVAGYLGAAEPGRTR